jgi:hypothetical protein
VYVEGSSTLCPLCGQLAQLRFFQHTDEQGHPLREELEFSCPEGHALARDDVADLWTAAHAGAR